MFTPPHGMWMDTLSEEHSGFKNWLRRFPNLENTQHKAMAAQLFQMSGEDIILIEDGCIGVRTPHKPFLAATFHQIVEACSCNITPSVFTWSHAEHHEELIWIASTSDPFEANLPHLIHEAIQNVSRVVFDFEPMKACLHSVGAIYQNLYIHPEKQCDAKNIGYLLQSIHEEVFLFLGYRYRSLQVDDGDFNRLNFHFVRENEAPDLGILQRLESPPLEWSIIPMPSEPSLNNCLHITKTSIRSTIAPFSRTSTIQIWDVDPYGTVCGVHQWIGVFREAFFKKSVLSIPFLASKAREILKKIGVQEHWSEGKDVLKVIQSFPLDDLFQKQDLSLWVEEVWRHPHRLHVFLRHVSHEATVLIFVPRRQVHEHLTQNIRENLETWLAGRVTSHHVFMDDFALARFIFVVSTENVSLDTHGLRDHLERISWGWDQYLGFLSPTRQFQFPQSYKDTFSPHQALRDITLFEALSDMHPFAFTTHHRGIHVYANTDQLSLSLWIPIFENLGLSVHTEISHSIIVQNHAYGLYDFSADLPDDPTFLPRFQDAFLKIWREELERDDLNRLIKTAGFTWIQVSVFRTLIHALVQMGLPVTKTFAAHVLNDNPSRTQIFWDIFSLRFDPKHHDPLHEQEAWTHWFEDLKKIQRPEEDRFWRLMSQALQALVRINLYQDSFEHVLAFKFHTQTIDNVPPPRPLYEIYLYSPFMEGCHLRFGRIARGGIRWSDREQDFRREILGLVKAQVVKNAVIVPTGSKGGFICKRYRRLQSEDASPEILGNEVQGQYEHFIKGLLSLTDNHHEDAIVHPENTVIHDAPDPYLVVAADKGTARFSDTANRISKEKGFWLEDAFASGGSHGYDHKKMGITSRGAWVSVRRHMKELGLDESLRVIGIGDMGGDVFGNGLLISDRLFLVAAFNHDHIFLDPSPNPSASFQERKRLFELSGREAGWDYYDERGISTGGGVFSRREKVIPLSPEVKAALDLPNAHPAEIAPDDLISLLLKAPVDLLWFGGIGTFVKASTEVHSEVSDPINDALRIDAIDIRAKIVGEGANLGMTQKARIEYALQGGRINTDSLDNSAGVDCSDHEVNIKILFQRLERNRDITREERDRWLSQMEDEVADLVLSDNDHQNRLISLCEEQSRQHIDLYKDTLRALEHSEILPLKRNQESLPSDDVCEERHRRNQGLTRPELSILCSYAKIDLKHILLSQGKPRHEGRILAYFPSSLQERASDVIKNHPLKNELWATLMANDVVNILGPCAVFDLAQALHTPAIQVLESIIDVWDVFSIRPLWEKLCRAETEYPWSTLLPIFQRLQGILVHLVLVRGQSSSRDFLYPYEILNEELLPQNLSDWPILFEAALQSGEKNFELWQDRLNTYREAWGISIITDLFPKIQKTNSWEWHLALMLRQKWTHLWGRLCQNKEPREDLGIISRPVMHGSSPLIQMAYHWHRLQ